MRTLVIGDIHGGLRALHQIIVRANYKNHTKGIHATNEFLLLFFENLLLGEKNSLQNREMHVHYIDPVKVVNDPVKVSVLQQLQQKPNANYAELAVKAGCSTATIKRHVQELKKLGLIERIGSDKTGYWKILKK